MIKIPLKQCIVNSDAQIVLLGSTDDGAADPFGAYADADIAALADSFILEGFLPKIYASQLEVLATNTRVRLDTPSAGAAGAIEVEIAVGGALNKGDIWHVRVKDPLLVPTEFQQYTPLEKRYQSSVAVPAGANSEDTIATHMVNTINADPHAHVTAAIKAGGTVNDGIIVLTAKEVGHTVEFYVSQENEANGLDVTSPATLTYDGPDGGQWDILTAASAPVNTYDYLKNIDWARGLDFDRNVEYYPEYGAQYDSYYFEVNWDPKDIGGQQVPSLAPEQQSGRTAFKIWVKEGLTLNTALDLWAGDLNAALA